MSEEDQQPIDVDTDILDTNSLSIEDTGEVSGSAITEEFGGEYRAQIIITSDRDDPNTGPLLEQMTYAPNVIVTDANGRRVYQPNPPEISNPKEAIEQAVETAEEIVNNPDEHLPEKPYHDPGFSRVVI